MKRGYGFIHEIIEIKILILFILQRLPEPVSIEDLTELTMCDDGIGYFDFMDCVVDLVKTEHLQYKDDKYHLTEKGARNGGITESSLPFSVRVDVENSISEYRGRQCRNEMIKASHRKNQDGSCTVTLSLKDGLGEIISMDMFAVSERQALELEKGFRKNAESIYNAIIGMILGKKSEARKASPRY